MGMLRFRLRSSRFVIITQGDFVCPECGERFDHEEGRLFDGDTGEEL